MEILIPFGIMMGSVVGILASLSLLAFIVGVIRASR